MLFTAVSVFFPFAVTSPLNLSHFSSVRLLGDEAMKAVTVKAWTEKWGVTFEPVEFERRKRLVPTADRSSVAAAVELLPGTPALWALIRENKTFQLTSLMQSGKALGMQTMDVALEKHVRAGTITPHAALEAWRAGEPFPFVEPSWAEWPAAS